ncbi:MAG: PSD1 and planctomycete cytochrome C domain-containing protein [Verrucomicrobia bacterium]|nr:PSD1 and planctomycete cytochrome C domain-containing protein [Verrucomicrobiota bacterium]
MFVKNANAFVGFAVSLLAAFSTFGKEVFPASDLVFFESKVRPLLIERCYKCHSHKAKKLKGDLYLDSRKGTLHGGETGPAVKPGDLSGSLLIEAIRYRDPDLQMPPKTKLSASEIETLERWVSMGAPWPDEPEPTGGKVEKEFDLAGRKASHWSWKPVVEPALPQVKDGTWGKLPIDRFILSRLENSGLTPAGPADRRTLIRRATFDLRGMPPTPEEVNAFVEDDSENAFEQVVDRLLDSSEFGEKWARHWMDLFRYAESRGHEFDANAANAFRYRDYLIRALNADVPYDQFVTEHVAGDLLEKPRLHPETGANESILATGFWFLGEWIHSPVDTRQDEADRFDNMIGVFSKSFLGLTVACARCHDHKFDAISTKDFYAIQGYLQSSGYRQARYETMDHNGRIARELDQLERSSELGKKLGASLGGGSTDLAQYILAAGRILRGDVDSEKDVLVKSDPASTDPIVFADFEDGTYGKWLSSGTAFGKGPVTLETKASYQGDIRHRGKFFVNSHNVRLSGKTPSSGLADDQLGSLTSPRFRIERDFITFLVGGGAYQKETCVNLLVDGKVVLSATGRSNNTMLENSWDVRRWRGAEARVQVVDQRKGGWGNIGLDHIVFTNEKMAGTTKLVANVGFDDASVAFVAKTEKLNRNKLLAWSKAFAQAKSNRADPLAPLASVFANEKPNWNPLRSANANLESRRSKFLESFGKLELAVDYGNLAHGLFMQDGVTFGQRVKLPGDLLLDGEGGIAGIARWGMARRESVWRGLRIVDSAKDAGSLGFTRAGITLRSPTFTNTHGDAHYLVRGKGKAVAVVDSHRLIQGPLHGNMAIDVGRPGELTWVTQDLDKRGQTYLGHRLHVEFTPTDANDFEVLMIDLSNDSGARGEVLNFLKNPPNALVLGADGFGEAPSREQLAALLSNNLKSVAGKLGNPFGNKPADFEQAYLADWLVRNKGLTGLDGAKNVSDEFLSGHKELVSRIKRDSRTAMAMLDGSPDDEYVFLRGNHRSLGDEVPRRFLEALGGVERPAPEAGSGRLELARQITDPKRNPFVSRVLVNRLWHHLFGRGIVPSTDDFGVLGQRPTHPDLLDHLAGRLVDNKWSVKAMIKEIIISRTYQMCSEAKGPGESKDPSNALWHRANLRRLQSESIRDALLFVSGRLDEKMYGKSVATYLTAFMEGRGRPGAGPLDGNGRRSVYVSVRRNFLSPFMLAFDTPSPFNAVGRRTNSNVPSQALILMNDPFVVGQATLWGKKIISQFSDVRERISFLYESAFARPPSEFEMNASRAFIVEQAKLHGVAEDHELPWKDLAHAIINTKEFIFLN